MSVEARLVAALESELEQVRPRAGAWAKLRSRLEGSPPVPLWHRVWDLGLSRREFLGRAATAAVATLLPVPALLPAPPGPPEPPPAWGALPRGGAITHHPPPPRPGPGPAGLPVFEPPTPDEHDLYLPGIGFRRPRGMASREPVSWSAAELTLTVHRVAVLGRGTWLDVEVSGLGHDPANPGGGGIDVVVRADGQSCTTSAWRRHGRRLESGRIAERIMLRLGPLRPDLSEVEVVASGELIPEDLRAVVPLVPATEVGRRAIRLSGPAATVGGVAIRAANAVLGGDPTVLLLEVETAPPWRHVWVGSRMGGRGRGQELALRDAQGREYLEEIAVLGLSHTAAVYDDVVTFPRLPADAAGLRLAVPTVTVAGDEGSAEVRVPLARLRPGEPLALGQDLRLGSDPLRVTAAELWELATGRLLTLRLDLGPRRAGRLLLGPGEVLLDGEDRGFRGRWSGGVDARYDSIDVPLPAQTRDVASVTMRLPRVEIVGPWIVPLGL